MNRSPHTCTARVRLLLALCAALAARPALAQRADSARVGVTKATAAAAPAPDSVRGPPITPRRAFFYSLALPGLGQTKLHRSTAATLFATVELVSIAMAQKSGADLRLAKEFQYDSIYPGYAAPTCPTTQPTDGSQYACTPGARDPLAFNRYRGGRVGARRLHYEDWLAVIGFNHLISGADAFIAAQLWDLPTRVAVEPRDDGRTALALRVSW